MRRMFICACAIALIGAGASGCGGSSNPRAAITGVVNDYFAALASNDFGRACDDLVQSIAFDRAPNKRDVCATRMKRIFGRPGRSEPSSDHAVVGIMVNGRTAFATLADGGYIQVKESEGRWLVDLIS